MRNVVNISHIVLLTVRFFVSDAEKSLLVIMLWFSLQPKKVNYTNYLTNFTLFFRSRHNLDVLSNSDLDLVKTKIKFAALSFFHFYYKIFKYSSKFIWLGINSSWKFRKQIKITAWSQLIEMIMWIIRKKFSKTTLSLRKLIQKLGLWSFRPIMKNVLMKF